MNVLAGAADRRTIGCVDDASAAGRDETPHRYGQALQGVSAIIAPATLLTGIAFYFGWQRLRAYDGYFGLNSAAVGYSTRDYVLNSLNALFLPVIVVLLGLMALAFAHAYVGHVHRRGADPARLRRVSEACLVGGGLMVLVGAIGAFGAFPFHVPYLISTLFPAAGVLLIAHGVDLHARLRGDPPLPVGGRVLVALFVAVCLFWAAGLYAGTVGREQAARAAGHLGELPGVSILGSSDLGLPNGVPSSTASSTGGSSEIYTGLRLLALSSGTMFLLPQNWTSTHGTLYAVPEAAATEVAFTPATVHGSGSLLASGLTGDVGVQGAAPHELVSRTRRVGSLTVRLSEGLSDVVTLVNRTPNAISGVSVAATLAGRAHPRITSAAAHCGRTGRAGAACTVNAIPPRHRFRFRISYRGPSDAHGRLTVAVGAARGALPLQLSH
jgi:hypothetical protein